MGSGTTLYECERLKRNYIGFDINQDIIDYVENKMTGVNSINYFIFNSDVTDSSSFDFYVKRTLKEIGKQKVDFILSHPPYWDIIKFTDREEDLSNTKNLDTFIAQFVSSMRNAINYLKAGKHFIGMEK